MHNILALDLGTKTLGKAVYLAQSKTSVPAGVFTYSENYYKRAREHVNVVVNEKQISMIVLGLPLNVDGSEGQRATSARRFCEDLRNELTIPVVLVDERFTTIEATERLVALGYTPMQIKQKVDEYSALIILETYLETRNKND